MNLPVPFINKHIAASHDFVFRFPSLCSPRRNLLLPRGMASERPWARFRVRIYRAEGLPTMEAGLLAKMSKATDRTVFIDPYVHVTFAGQQVCYIYIYVCSIDHLQTPIPSCRNKFCIQNSTSINILKYLHQNLLKISTSSDVVEKSFAFCF